MLEGHDFSDYGMILSQKSKIQIPDNLLYDDISAAQHLPLNRLRFHGSEQTFLQFSMGEHIGWHTQGEGETIKIEGIYE